MFQMSKLAKKDFKGIIINVLKDLYQNIERMDDK